MRTLFDDASVVQYDDFVGIADRREAVRHHHDRLVLEEPVEALHDRAFVVRVQRVGRLVEEEVLRILVGGPRDQKPLFLPDAQSVSVGTDLRVVAQGQFVDEGVDVDELLISQPDTGEQALEICDLLVRSGTIDCVVIDSVAALVPRAEIEGEMGDATVGLQARLMSQALRKLTGSLSKSNTTCIFINQLREKIGVMFGSPETTTGGRALKFYSSVRIDIRRIESMKKDGEFIGNRVRAKIVKNKVAPPFRQAEFDLMYGEGISKEGCVLDMGVEAGIVNKSGSWFNYGEERLGQGRDAAKRTLQENPDLRNEIENKVRQHFDLPTIDWGEAASEVAQQQAQGE